METISASRPAPRAGRREWIGLAVLALPTLLLSLDISVLYLALPHLSADLGAGGTEQLWILDVYSFALAGFLVTMGTLGDRIGRRRLLLAGAAGFGLASVLAAYATSPAMLIAARVLLGVAGATLMPSTMALIRTMFQDPRQMGQAVGVWFSCFLGGMTLGPLVGGLLLEHFWWGSAFLLGVPFMVVLLVAGPILLPEHRDPAAGRLDPASVALSLGAILPVVYGLKELARNGLHAVPVLAVVAGAAVAVVFVRRQRRLTSPLLDLRLFRNPVFTMALAVGLLGGIVMAGISLMSTLYLQTVAGLSPMGAGLWLAPQNVAMVAATVVAPVLARRLPPAYVIALGLAIAAVGLLVHTQVAGVGLLVIGLVLASFGVALPMSLTMSLLLRSAPPERAGSAASLSETGGEFGVAVGVAAMGSLGALVYRSHLALPAGLPAQTAEAVKGGVAAAVASARELPAALGADVLDAARAAFTSGLHVVAAVGAVIFMGTAVLAAVVLRGRTGDGGTAPAAQAPIQDPALEPAGVG
ncbi:MFS transporter [Microbispora sp. ATCC PTA-5024]|uniref:MFS transporter n=1 Tax=Microbispora sp. ATCC PTA-5024 TaxID=316330 RepID=UPI0003DBA265|nr:MFS transporter [Microbispora sp. ATCC PTA-5024]ETK37886.1 MFS transporter [Microbispora sp. ATCC PTA-5024]